MLWLSPFSFFSRSSQSLALAQLARWSEVRSSTPSHIFLAGIEKPLFDDCENYKLRYSVNSIDKQELLQRLTRASQNRSHNQ